MENNVTDKTGIRKITKWIIGVVTVCILIYLAIRHLDMIAAGISWFFRITFPLLLGIIMALILNVPMRPIEKYLHIKKEQVKRPVAIAFPCAGSGHFYRYCISGDSGDSKCCSADCTDRHFSH